MDQYLKQFDQCRQWEKPFCTAACPFHVDVLDFQEKMARGSFNAAFKTFRNAVGFPDIVAALCPQYCGAVCPRKDLDQEVQLHLLEQTCVRKATKKDPTDYNVPVKNRKIGIIGGGISGLACALRLSSKKYQVTLYEKSGRLGGQLWDLLPDSLFLEDIQRQFQFETYSLLLNTEIHDIKELASEEFEAIYIATGKDGTSFGLLENTEEPCRIEGDTALFAGGTLIGKDPVRALADGLDMAWAIEIFLKTKKLEYPKTNTETKVSVAKNKLIYTEALLPSDDGIFTEEEAVAEASRCVRCQCDSCCTDCDISAFYKKWPLKMRDEIMATISPSDSILHSTPAIKLINTCTYCNLFEEGCPADIEFCQMLKKARYRLHHLGKMPGAYHQFWLADMDHANGDFAAVKKFAPGQQTCKTAFFPGCQLGATDPCYVEATYRHLLSLDSTMGLLLRCCGVPAQWSGNEEMDQEELQSLRRDWEELGKPVLILACPSCARRIREQLPEIDCTSLYEFLAREKKLWSGSQIGEALDNSSIYSIFDPCSAKHQPDFQEGVRSLIAQCQLPSEELPKGDHHGCCGFGGHAGIANPAFAKYVAQDRSHLSENPYITYCINCRDIFVGEEKPALHILDLLFDINTEASPLPTMTQRRRNRSDLKETLLKEIWGETMDEKPQENTIRLQISADIQQKMDSLKLLEEDLTNVIEFAKTTGRRLFDPAKNSYTVFRELGFITCWIEYRLLENETYEIVNVYTHRIKIELEMMWNGSKTDFDLR